MKIAYFFIIALLFHAASTQARPELKVDFAQKTSGFNFVSSESIGDIVVDSNDHEVVKITAELLRDDFERVFNKVPEIKHQLTDNNLKIVAGTLQKSNLVEQLVKQHSINTKKMQACFECYQFNFITHKGASLLVIVGADRRGTAYGLLEISRAIGISPWLWWADVNPAEESLFSLSKQNLFFNSPSVKYRGIFINDEDFGLFPWAAYNFEKTGNIGPKTYEKVFELLLRLRANTLWPAMHEVTDPFNANPINAKNADRYAIVMGSSHAEPMLRNNVGEWKAPADNYNFITHKNDVVNYWKERLKANAGYENLYTLGMRGIHDSNVVGATTMEEKQNLLNSVLKSQYNLLNDNVGDPQHIPQIFVPYKEVLDIYEKGLDIPANVTLVWPDDNFGYLRRFADDTERQRSGGTGLYYHFSYLGAPLSYLWLSTIPLDLARVELTRAYTLGARDVWMFNVGDIKPAEINLSHAMDLAWDIEKTGKLNQKDYLRDFFTINIDKKLAPQLAEIMDEYYKLNYLRKPEHLQYFLPKELAKLSGMTDAELKQRADRAHNLIKQVNLLTTSVPQLKADSFFELVEYPAKASALAHQRFAYLELFAKTVGVNPGLGHYLGNQAVLADVAIKALTEKYNRETQHGKWNYLINEEPADNIYPFLRISKPLLPIFIADIAEQTFQPQDVEKKIVYQAEDYSNKDWQKYDGIGAIKALTPSASVVIPVQIKSFNVYCVKVDIIPIFPDEPHQQWKIIADINGKIQEARFSNLYSTKNWAQGVLNNYISAFFEIDAKATIEKIKFTTDKKNLLLDKIRIYPKPGDSCQEGL